MKLIIREYLASLRERGELDAILPDLLSQLGLNVFTRPGRGTRQDGVDVGAVGSMNGGPEKVYLFSIKPGDLTRKDWDGHAIQSLRPSLNEILDAYIPNRLPVEHRGKEVVICICIGGDVQEQVRPQLAGFMKNAEGRAIFEEWNGDRLASLIQSCFLREDILPEASRSSFRKALALLDEPEASYRQFSLLIRSLAGAEGEAGRVMALRQMGICLWILFGWAREARNLEAAYLSGELVVLRAWMIVRRYASAKGKTAEAVKTAFLSILAAYEQICQAFLDENVLPHVAKLHALASAIRGACSLDISLRLFDLLGRVAMAGLWAHWYHGREVPDDVKTECMRRIGAYSSAMKAMISNNPALFLPIKDDCAIDVAVAATLLAIDKSSHADLSRWLREMLNRASFSFRTHGGYPCTLRTYTDLLDHPKIGDAEYRKEVTAGSVLYPVIALWAALLNDQETYESVQQVKREHLQHCNFQLWYPDETSEELLYSNDESHGAVLSNICVEEPMKELLSQVFGECDHSAHFKDLSAIKYGWWPLVVVACRHYRLPIPPHFWRS